MTHEPIDANHYTNNISSSVRYINYQYNDYKEEIPEKPQISKKRKKRRTRNIKLLDFQLIHVYLKMKDWIHKDWKWKYQKLNFIKK